jgi:CheY-like chemotaxis protein
MGLKMALALQPDLILLDLLMPRMDGLTVLARMRENEWGKTARVVVMTNLSIEDKETRARQLGVEDYLIKTDVTLSEIVDLLRRKLEV